MTRGILIAGNESTLSRAIEAEVAGRVERFAAALIPNRLSDQTRMEGGLRPSGAARPADTARLPLEWNPGSPISARTLILAAENRLERIDEAILVCSPPSIRRPAAELPLADIEILINDHVKGWFFLVRELAACFRARQKGILALVYGGAAGGGKDDAADLLGPSSLASFQAFTRGLLASALDEPYLAMGFSSSDAGNEAAFASFVVKFLDEGSRRDSGKLHKYGKFPLFK
jgi:NAD(P)-dependent dehydrogenase (short-subunit alcohol dehydrogenase family)